jgi:2-C-methyl-D-erythritol 4-phosphate cytidylyltransferase
MVIAAILAGGSGSRMGNSSKPKQFFELGDRPILIHTAEKLKAHPEIDALLVLCPAAWRRHTEDLLRQYHLDALVTEGGATRNGTLANALACVEKNFGTEDTHILLTHDAVRPFLTHRIISDNIAAARTHGACDTVIPATDTIVRSTDTRFIQEIPPRAELYQGQTPQTFNAAKLRTLLDTLTAQEEETLTDACKIFTLRGESVALVRGEIYNIKITYPFDVKLAKALMDIDGETP